MLKRLELTNFRCFRHEVFDFSEPRVLILADNDKGKSTVLDAIRWLMTGRCRGLDDGGRGVATLVHDGPLGAGEQRVMSVVGNVVRGEDVRTIGRYFNGTTSSFTMSGAMGQSGDQEAAFFAWLGITDRRQLSVILDGELFGEMAHKDAKALLMAFLPVSVVDPLSPERSLLPDDVDALYKEAVTVRRDAKRDLAKFGEVVPPAEPVGDIDGVKALLARLRGERETLVGQRGASAGASQEAARAALAAAGQKLVTAKFNLSALFGVSPLDAVRERLAVARSKQEAAKQTLGAAEAVAAAISFEDKGHGLIADQLESHDPATGCVLCAEVPCKTTKAAFAKVAKGARKADADVMAQREAFREATANARAANDALEALDSEVEHLAGVLPVAEELEETITTLTAKMPELVAAVEAPVEPSELDQQIDLISGRITKGEAILAAKQALQAEHERYERDMAKATALKEQVDLAERQVAAYGPGPDGVVAKAVESVRDRFHAAVNAHLAHFGYQFALSIEPWDIQINGRRWSLLAESVRFRVAIALQVALAQVVGFDMTLIDRLDMLTREHRATTQKLVMGCGLGLVVLAKSQDAGAPAPAIAGVQVVTLR